MQDVAREYQDASRLRRNGIVGFAAAIIEDGLAMPEATHQAHEVLHLIKGDTLRSWRAGVVFAGDLGGVGAGVVGFDVGLTVGTDEGIEVGLLVGLEVGGRLVAVAVG